MATLIQYHYANSNPSHSHAYLLPPVESFLKSLPVGGRLLDYGCGNGSLTSRISSDRLIVEGVDGSAAGIEYARRQYPGIRFRVADLTGVLFPEFEKAAYDGIISTEVIEHIYDPRSFVRNAFELLRPGGQLLVTTPYHGYLKNLALALTGHWDTHFTALWDCGHIKFWSKRTLRTLLSEAGFTVMYFEGAGRLPYLWKSMVVIASKPNL